MKILAEEAEKQRNIPLCPACGSSMVRRVAKVGKFAGKSFWGCSAFPGCKGIVSEERHVPVIRLPTMADFESKLLASLEAAWH